MIVGKRHWLILLFSWRGSILPAIWARLFMTVGIATIITVLDHLYDHILGHSISTLPFTLIGLALGIFLGFRNNTSYDRFWEGRKLWGRLVNGSRTFARQVQMLVVSEEQAEQVEAFRTELTYRMIGYVHAVRLHLRDQDRLEELEPFIPKEELEAIRSHVNRPISILHRTGERLRDAWKKGWISEYHLLMLEESLREFTAIQGACERIKSTPIPHSYTVLIHRLTAFYCFGLPFGVVENLKLFTPVVVLMVSYAFFGLDAIGDEIEEPFGEAGDDLPLSTISRMIEVNLRQSLGETETPPLLKPGNGGVLT